LENDFKISEDDIPGRIEDFADALGKIFDVGAKFIEIQIMKRLYEKVGSFKYVLKQNDIVFTEYIEVLREYYCCNV